MKKRTYADCALSELKIKHKICIFLLGTVVMLVFISCGTIPIGQYNPNPAMAKGVVKNVTFSRDIALINNQPSTEDHYILFRETIVNYNKFTQSIVDALTIELERNGLLVNESSEKKLYVKVTNVDFKLASSRYRGVIYAEVRTGNNQVEFFDTHRASYASPFNLDMFPTKPLDSAFKDIVREILENKQLNEYINN